MIQDIVLAAGEHAAATETPIFWKVPAADILPDIVLSEILTAKHRCNQEALPVLLGCSGGDSLLKKLGDLKGYAERMFTVIDAG